METIKHLTSQIPSFVSMKESFQSNFSFPKPNIPNPSIPKLTDYFSIIVIVIIFWPIIVYFFLAFASVSNWIFWIATSLLLGAVQFVYVVYQFFRIFLDVFFLATLKTFAMLRSRLLTYSVSWFGITTKGKRRGRRREWRKELGKAECYADYQKIWIEEPTPSKSAKKLVPAGGSGGDVVSSSSSQENGKNGESYSRNGYQDSDSKSSSIDKASANKEKKQKKLVRRIQSCMDLHGHDKPLSKTPSKDGEYSELVSTDNTGTIIHAKSQLSLTTLATATPTIAEETEIKRQLGMVGGMLLATTNRLREARAQAERNGDASSLKFLLSGVVKRNHLTVDDILIDDARSVAESGQHRLSRDTRKIVRGYNDEVEMCLECISNQINVDPEELTDRLKLLHKLKQNTGRTALMLSGGGAQTMNHLGIIRALIESNVYSEIPVISGTSGGSSIAAMCAIKTPEELLRDVCVPHLSTDYMLTGEMKRRGIRWCPKLIDMGINWLKTGLLFESKEFKKLCDFYFSDTTFEEAFQRTGKHVCITVTASRANAGGRGVQRLLLNHISTPHVTVSSAVVASCALPGLMNPAKLETKNKDGTLEPFEVDGVDWVDGSVQADIPFRRISTLFNVSNYIVCQVNPHVVPLLNKPHHPDKNSLYWKLFKMYEWDIRNRALNLGRLGLFPKIFGQDVSKMFKQKYHGNLTIVPRFTKAQVFGLKVIINPSMEDMKVYIQNGQVATWPYVDAIDQTLRIEKAIERSLTHLQDKFHDMTLDPTKPHKSLLAANNLSSFIKRYSAGKQTDLLESEFENLEAENLFLKRKVMELEADLARERRKKEETSA